MSLKEYHRKRDFNKTNEPRGKEKQQKNLRLLYLIQKHAASHLHYDFRLELDGVLKSWAVPKGPSLDPKVKHLAVQVEDHPMEYANFEGIIPKGEYGGGTVMLWDTGHWQPLDDNVQQAYDRGDLNFILQGKKLHGRWKLIRLKKSKEKSKQQWLLFKVKDQYSRSEDQYNITKMEPDSAESDRTMEQIADDKKVWTREDEIKTLEDPERIDLASVKGAKKEKLFGFISPELATLANTPPKGEDWLHEIKWDGYRLQAHCLKDNIVLLTRRNNDWTDRFPKLVQALKSLKLHGAILDGEIVALNKEKQADFQTLQNSIEDANVKTDLVYYVFDLLYLNGYNLLAVPLIQRKEILKQILNQSTTSIIKFNDHIISNGQAVFENACNYGLEGIISKKINSIYLPRRARDWLKSKCNLRQEFIIGGYTDSSATQRPFAALLLGYYDQQKKLIYCGKVGTGFTEISLTEIALKLKKYQQKVSPFNVFPLRVTGSIHWLKPELLAEVEYLKMTRDGMLRHPSFKGIREDKTTQHIALETAQTMNKKRNSTEIAEVKFTNLARVLYPEQNLTKGDLVDYYHAIADWILPHIVARPLTLVRCPSGIDNNCFYQKHSKENKLTAIKSIAILEHNRYEPYIYIDNLSGLLSLVQMGVLEIHPWGSNINSIEQPDRIIFDLDPGPEVAWSEVIQCAFDLHEFLDFLQLKNFVKTTGGKGLHIVVPIKPTLSWIELRDVTKRIVDIMVQTKPTKFIATMSKAKRQGKIFIDYLRNVRGATAIATFSTRARSRAPIATPLAWNELSVAIKSDSFDINNINERLKHLKSGPWEGFFKTKQTISNRIKSQLFPLNTVNSSPSKNTGAEK